MDAVVTRKYTFFEGINVPGGSVAGASSGVGSGKLGKYGKFTKKDKFGKDKLDLDKLGKDMFSKDWDLKDLLGKKEKGSFDVLDGGKDVDFWSAFGPGRLLKNKIELKKKKFSKLGLGALMDFETTSPFSGFLN